MNSLENDHDSKVHYYVRISVSIKFKLIMKNKYFWEIMQIHINFTCRQWVSIDDPSVPLNAISVHINTTHRETQCSLPVHDGLTSAAILTAVITHQPQSCRFPSHYNSDTSQHSSVPYRSVAALLIVAVREAKCLGLWNWRDGFESNSRLHEIVYRWNNLLFHPIYM